MDDLDKMARELLAAEFDAADSTKRGEQVRAGTDNAPIVEYATAAIRPALLSAPPEMVDAAFRAPCSGHPETGRPKLPPTSTAP